LRYINEINAFDRRMHRVPLSPLAQLLWYKLMQFSNRLHWPPDFQMDNDRVMNELNVSALQTLINARKELVADGLLEFTPGTRGKPSTYRLLSVEALEAPNIQWSDEDTPDAFMGGVREDVTAYFGYTEDLGCELAQVVDILWAEYHPGEKPTRGDTFQVFQYIKTQTHNDDGGWTMEFPKEKKELLAYAFDQARQNGKVTWSYINGIYRNFEQRGITSVEDAYDYEYSRRKEL
jgi:DnaD/phage-associated family protein